MGSLIELLKYIFLGAIQGITETLPISSSGHLVIMQELVGLQKDDNLTFEILLHFGSLIAIVIFYYKIILELIKNFFVHVFIKDKQNTVTQTDFKYAWLLVVATIPAGLAGMFLEDVIGKHLNNTLSVGIALLFTALVLYFISQLPKGFKDKQDITFKDAFLIGLMQALAIIPGISRSGSTISMGLYRKLEIDQALRFSFLLFIPVALGATIIDAVEYIQNPGIIRQPILYLIAFLTSIVFTLVSLRIFTDIIKRGKLVYFSYYCIFAGLISLSLYFIF
jgi:undecaprenyl-diphosphatase